MIGTGENKVCKLKNSFTYEICTPGYFVYMSIGFTLLLHILIFLYANLLRFAAIYLIVIHLVCLLEEFSLVG